MKTAGIIAEYNPFHNGHQYHIEETRRRTGADYIIVVMSGNFVQRGVPAYLPKEHRTRMALFGGADLALELPIPFATASAEDFALYGVSMLQAAGCVDFLSFGCELEELSLLQKLAQLCVSEPPLFQETLKQALKKGQPYPRARQAALEACCPDLNCDILSQPNLILAMEYLKALKKTNSSIRPVLIPRCDGGYHSHAPVAQFASASAIRKMCSDYTLISDISNMPKQPTSIRPYLPESSFSILTQTWNREAPVLPDDLSQALGYQLLACRNGDLTRYADVSEELQNRILRSLTGYTTFSSFGETLKTKAYTRTRIDRTLLHLLFSVTKEDMATWKTELPSYLRILGFRKSAAPLLEALQAHASVPVLTKVAGYEKVLSPVGKGLLEKELFASHFYQQLIARKFGTENLKDEFRRPLVILNS